MHSNLRASTWCGPLSSFLKAQMMFWIDIMVLGGFTGYLESPFSKAKKQEPGGAVQMGTVAKKATAAGKEWPSQGWEASMLGEKTFLKSLSQNSL